MKTVEELVDKHFDKLFDETLEIIGDDLGELLIEITIPGDGKTIRRSWKDREKMLREQNPESS